MSMYRPHLLGTQSSKSSKRKLRNRNWLQNKNWTLNIMVRKLISFKLKRYHKNHNKWMLVMYQFQVCREHFHNTLLYQRRKGVIRKRNHLKKMISPWRLWSLTKWWHITIRQFNQMNNLLIMTSIFDIWIIFSSKTICIIILLILFRF